MESSKTATYIRAIAKTRSISAAADELAISQPALSSYLKKAESRIGAELFDRTSTPVKLTDAGRSFLRYLDDADALTRDFERSLLDISQLKSGSLVVGGAGSFNVTFLPRAVTLFCDAHPGIDVRIVDGTAPDLADAALRGDIDVFITPTPNRKDEFCCEPLVEERIFFCVPSAWPIVDELPAPDAQGWASIDGGDLVRLACQRFVMLREDLQIGQRIRALFAKYDVAPEHPLLVDQTMTSMALTLAGAGISLATESTVAYAGWTSKPALYYLEDELSMRTLYAAYPKRAHVSQATRELIRIMHELAETERAGKR